MVKVLDAINVIDVEATCWSGEPPLSESTREPEVSEIIEIGICVLDVGSLRVRQNEGIIIRPQLSKISKFCTELTSLTQKQVDEGIPFEESLPLLTAGYGSRKTTWASWGDYDRVQFEKTCEMYNVKYPFGRTHINIKNLHAISGVMDQECSLIDATKDMFGEFDGKLHRGVDDALNAARILARLIAQLRQGRWKEGK